MSLLCIVLLALGLRLFKLDILPAEMWGDVIEHHKLTKQILEGNVFFGYRFGGDGALLSYVNAILTFFFGLNFLTLKLSSVLVGTLLVLVAYLLAYEFFHKREIAHLTAFLTAVSFWGVSFSRQAKPYILVPLLVSLTFIFFLRKRPSLAGAFLGLGMYTQAAFWGTPLLFLTNVKMIASAALIVIPLTVETLMNFNSYIYRDSFFSEKLGFASSMSLFDYVNSLLSNIGKNALALHVRGDAVFRHTISGQPHLDTISGIFFLIGLFLIVKKAFKENHKTLQRYFILPLFLIHVPALLDVNNPLSTPAMGRTIGILPFIHMSTAYGLHAVASAISSYIVKKTKIEIYRNYTRLAFLSLTLCLISLVNTYRYFLVYPKGLPNGNIPFGRIIASYIDRYPLSTRVYVVGCCWGEWGQPEWGGIQFALKIPREVIFVASLKEFSCSSVPHAPNGEREVVFFSNPSMKIFIARESACVQYEKHSAIEEEGITIAQVVEGRVVKP